MILPDSLRRRLGLLAAPFLAIAAGGLLLSCEDTTPTVGGQLASGEVQIALDSLIWDGTQQYIYRGDEKTPYHCPKISYTTIFDDAVDTRSATNLIGRISVPEYGDLKCSFVSRMLCTTSLAIPDSIKSEQIDSMKIIMTVPRGDLTGDSLAPQQLKVYRLTKSLPADIDNRFDPTGYYDPANPLGSHSFTLSRLGLRDSLYVPLIAIQIPLPREMALETVNAYRDEKKKSIFAWPQTFEQYFHGIYVEPTFGRGCIANIAYTDFAIYYNYKQTVASKDSEGNPTTTVATRVGVAGVFTSSPIVLSSNNVIYQPSDFLKAKYADNEALVTSPGGYRIDLTFPGRELADIYNASQSKLSVISNLLFSVPVEEINNEYGLTPPPYLVMVKTSKLKEFLASNSLPDGKDSFYAAYDSKAKRYSFTSMRSYILDLIKNGVKEEDLKFTIVPANLEFEKDDESNSYANSYMALMMGYYGYYPSSNSNNNKEPIKCTPYISKPSMCRLKMDEARTIFSYSIQQMK
ncbi:MAG: DUF4270 domain-containing protein [Muribaculaceae bacterium]|nr:DUF4270 domain-containing protein [Muribaculaceae bacterium]MDE6552902.1 DUF4270 domain-containing protein [Muribaculaceae bacterium]